MKRFTAAVGDDFTLRFRIRDHADKDVTGIVITAATLEIRDRPGADALFEQKTIRASIGLGTMTVALPNVDVPVQASGGSPNWSAQADGVYWARFTITAAGKRWMVSEIELVITD